MSSSSSSSKSSTIKEELNTSIKLDESYLQKSQVHIEADETDSPLNRMESVDTDSPLSEQAKIDDLNQVQGKRINLCNYQSESRITVRYYVFNSILILYTSVPFSSFFEHFILIAV